MGDNHPGQNSPRPRRLEKTPQRFVQRRIVNQLVQPYYASIRFSPASSPPAPLQPSDRPILARTRMDVHGNPLIRGWCFSHFWTAVDDFWRSFGIKNRPQGTWLRGLLRT